MRQFKFSYVVVFIVALDLASFLGNFKYDTAGIYFGTLISSLGWLLAMLRYESTASELSAVKQELSKTYDRTDA